MEALLTRTSRLPHFSPIVENIEATASGSAISAVTARAPLPMADATAVAPSPFMSLTTTVAPSAASLVAIAFPMPWAAPVTSATRPVSFPLIVFPLQSVVLSFRVNHGHCSSDCCTDVDLHTGRAERSADRGQGRDCVDGLRCGAHMSDPGKLAESLAAAGGKDHAVTGP